VLAVRVELYAADSNWIGCQLCNSIDAVGNLLLSHFDSKHSLQFVLTLFSQLAGGAQHMQGEQQLGFKQERTYSRLTLLKMWT
jgi:hypothetical protein